MVRPLSWGLGLAASALAVAGLMRGLAVPEPPGASEGAPVQPEQPGTLRWLPDGVRLELSSAETLLEEVDPHPLLAAVLLEPAAADELLSRCPAVDPVLATLCDPAVYRSRAAEVDALLATTLGSWDEPSALWAAEMAAGLGERGVALSRAVLADEVPTARPEQQRALAVEVLARVLPEPQVQPALRELLARNDGAALVAALELARLGDADASESVDALGRRLEGTAEGVTALWAARLAGGRL